MVSLRQHVVLESDDKMWHCAWSRDGSLLAACGSDKKCWIWRCVASESDFKVELVQVLGEGEEEGSPHTRTVRCCEFSPDGRFLATGSFDSTCVVWELGQAGGRWKPMATLEGHENEIKSIDWSHTGNLLATCGRDKSCWVWERSTDADGRGEWNCVSVLTGHEGDVKFVKFHPLHEHELVSCSYDNTVKVWRREDEDGDGDEDGGDFACAQTLRLKDTVWSLAFAAPAPHKLVVCCQDGTLQSFAPNEFAGGLWEPLFTVQHAHSRPIFSVDVHPATHQMVTASGDNSLGVWELKPETGFITKLYDVKQAHEQDVNCARFRPDVSASSRPLLVASCGDDGKVKVWAL